MFRILKSIFSIPYESIRDTLYVKREHIINRPNSKIVEYNDDQGIILLPLSGIYVQDKVVRKIGHKIANEKGLRPKYYYCFTAIDYIIYPNWSWLHKLNYLFRYNKILKWKICYLHRIAPIDIIFSNWLPVIKKAPSTDFNSNRDILNISENGIEIGEEIYDHFLRFRKSPTINTNDPFLSELIEYTKRLVSHTERIFTNNNLISHVLLPYSAYLHYGVVNKVALKHQKEVVFFGAVNYILSKSKLEHPYHTKEFYNYRRLFSKCQDKENKLNMAQKSLVNRLNGGKDQGTSYMKTSAYVKLKANNFKFPQNKSIAVIFLHCFFDNPHVYGSLLFPDFFQWLVYTLDIATSNPKVIYYVKRHPNAVKGNESIIAQLEKKYIKYENIIFLSQTVTNHQIISRKPEAIFTVYGTVAHEYAYIGIPVITAGENPHSDYSFVYKPNTITEYKNLVESVGQYKLPPHYKKEDILEFFYMHYLCYSDKYDYSNFNLIKNEKTWEFSDLKDYKYDEIIFNS